LEERDVDMSRKSRNGKDRISSGKPGHWGVVETTPIADQGKVKSVTKFA
jgi:hypothetical protein